MTTARFTAWNDQKALLELQGVKLNGINATVAQDLEPEYTTFAADEKTAFVNLQVRPAGLYCCSIEADASTHSATAFLLAQATALSRQCAAHSFTALSACPLHRATSCLFFSADNRCPSQENNAVAVLDVEKAVFTSIHALGFKDHNNAANPLDPSDQDGPNSGKAALINKWPVFGMYQPDEMRSFRCVCPQHQAGLLLTALYATDVVKQLK